MNNMNNTPQIIRSVEPDDAQLITAVHLALSMWAESSAYNGLTPDTDMMIAFAYNLRADPNSFVRIAVQANTCYGFMVGSIAPHGFHDSYFAYDRMLYVDPTRRGTSAARLMIKEFEKWSIARGATFIRLGISTGVHVERTEKFYNKLGYNTVGVLTMKEI